MSNVISARSPQVTVHNAGKPPGISIFAKIATEHVLGHEIFVYTIWRTLKSDTQQCSNMLIRRLKCRFYVMNLDNCIFLILAETLHRVTFMMNKY